jgi:hypothetical protein
MYKFRLKLFAAIHCDGEQHDSTIKVQQHLRSGEKRVGATINNRGKYTQPAKHTTNGKMMQTIIKQLEPFIY